MRQQSSPLGDPEKVFHYSYLYYCYGAELIRKGRHEEAMYWLISVLQVDREYEDPRIRDVSVKLLIKIVKRSRCKMTRRRLPC